MASGYPIERFDPLLRDVIAGDLVVKSPSSGQWELTDAVQQRLEELAASSGPLDSEHMVYFDHPCADCHLQISTRLHNGLYLCDSCRQLRTTPLAHDQSSDAPEIAKHRRRVVLAAAAAVFMLVIAGTAAAIAVTKKPSPPSRGNTGSGVGGIGNPSQLSCHPSGVAIGHVCHLVFQDLDSNGLKGRRVCFSTTAPNAVLGTTGECSVTDGQGKANGAFIAEVAGTATVTATETSAGGVVERTVRVTIRVGN